jgi:hypothetical protein
VQSTTKSRNAMWSDALKAVCFATAPLAALYDGVVAFAHRNDPHQWATTLGGIAAVLYVAACGKRLATVLASPDTDGDDAQLYDFLIGAAAIPVWAFAIVNVVIHRPF